MIGRDPRCQIWLDAARVSRRHASIAIDLAQDTVFLSDRTLLDQFCYSRVNKRLPRPSVNQVLIDVMEYVWLLERGHYAFYLYFPIEFEIAEVGVSDSEPGDQQDIDREFR